MDYQGTDTLRLTEVFIFLIEMAESGVYTYVKTNHIEHFKYTKLVCAKSLHLCLTVCDPMDCSPPGSSVHGILHAGILELVAISSCGRSSRPRDQTHISGSKWDQAHISGSKWDHTHISGSKWDHAHISGHTGRWIIYHEHLLGSPIQSLVYFNCSSIIFFR